MAEVVVVSQHAAIMKTLITSVLGLLLLHGLSYAASVHDTSAVQVVGFGECADCKDNNIDPSHAYSELRVRIDCKLQSGEVKTRSSEAGALDGDGKFRVWLPKEMVVSGEGKTKEECYAQLHDAASASPCPAHEGIEASKIVVKTKPDGQRVLEPAAGKVKFSAAICTSAFLKIYKKPFFKKPLPHLPSIPIFKPKPKPPISIPSVPIYKPKPKPPIYIPSVPIYKPKPKPPIYIPSVPIYKPKPKPPISIPSVPIYKPIPKPPISIPHVPIYKPKPKVPIYYKPPFFKSLFSPPPPYYEAKQKSPVYVPHAKEP